MKIPFFSRNKSNHSSDPPNMISSTQVENKQSDPSNFTPTPSQVVLLTGNHVKDFQALHSLYSTSSELANQYDRQLDSVVPDSPEEQRIFNLYASYVAIQTESGLLLNAIAPKEYGQPDPNRILTPGELLRAQSLVDSLCRGFISYYELSKSSITVQAGAMQWMVGNANATTGIKGVGDLFSKAVRGKVTGESAIKPEYTGTGEIILEPTYHHILLLDLSEWNQSIVLDDGLFLACESTLKQKAVMRSNISSAIAGNEGLFNLGIEGKGILCLESPCPQEELIEVELDNDVIKIDGNLAIAWSGSLEFTVERSGKTLVGSAASGEGLVNVYRGTGKVLIAPVDKIQ